MTLHWLSAPCTPWLWTFILHSGVQIHWDITLQHTNSNLHPPFHPQIPEPSVALHSGVLYTTEILSTHCSQQIKQREMEFLSFLYSKQETDSSDVPKIWKHEVISDCVDRDCRISLESQHIMSQSEPIHSQEIPQWPGGRHRICNSATAEGGCCVAFWAICSPRLFSACLMKTQQSSHLSSKTAQWFCRSWE